MADWSTIRWNLSYHWKVILLWAIGIGGAVVFSLWAGRAEAWVQGFQPFPDGEVDVVVHRFCRSDSCGYPSQAEWQQTIRSVMAEWNNAGSTFVFRERAAQGTDDPCRLPDTVTVILADPDNLCRRDGPLRFDARTEYSSYGGRRQWQVRIYINAESESSEGLGSIRRLLLHEFGHAVGLDHPDEAGQDVDAIMNSIIYHNHLQPDDIAGIRALYPANGAIEPLTGFLENPRDGSSHSGVGVISGWVCEAETVTIEFRGRRGPAPYHQVWKAAYGTGRADTQDDCGDSNNGFGLLFNWNNLGDGTHTVTAFVDGVELGRATVTVTTLDGEFPKGLSGGYVLEDFPYPGESVVIEWEQSLQNFVITESSTTRDDGQSEEPEECQFPDIPGACGEDG